MTRVGVVGYGHLGQYLVENIVKHEELELAWVWNRTELTGRLDDKYILKDLANCVLGDPDVIVEVAHPDITKQFGAKFLEVADFMIGSPTAWQMLNWRHLLHLQRQRTDCTSPVEHCGEEKISGRCLKEVH